jgi:hypothetical protein
MSKPAASTKDGKLKVVDTYLRAIHKLSSLAPEVAALEDEVKGREAEVFSQLIALLKPILPKIVRPVTLKEPWLVGVGKGTPKTLRDKGAVVENTFEHQESQGTHFHHATLLVVNERGRLVSVEEHAQWTEPGLKDCRWNVETSEIDITPDFAAEHLRGVLSGILDVLRDRLSSDLAEKRELKARLERLEEAERALRG